MNESINQLMDISDKLTSVVQNMTRLTILFALDATDDAQTELWDGIAFMNEATQKANDAGDSLARAINRLRRFSEAD